MKIALLALFLAGCAGQTFSGLCVVVAMGKNEQGQLVVKTYCEADK